MTGPELHMTSSDYIALGALAFSVVSFVITVSLDRRTKRTEQRIKAEEIRLSEIAREQARKTAVLQSLQGEKETVGFTAMHFARAGLPASGDERAEIITSLVQAAVFSGSDRARAMIYHVLRSVRSHESSEVIDAVHNLDRLFAEAAHWGLDPEELDLARGRRRVTALKKALGLDFA
jgi:hypothetical protein